MTENDREEQIVQAVQREAEDGRIPCERALALARTLGVSPEKMGRECNEAGIKIVRCQLGCFP